MHYIRSEFKYTPGNHPDFLPGTYTNVGIEIHRDKLAILKGKAAMVLYPAMNGAATFASTYFKGVEKYQAIIASSVIALDTYKLMKAGFGSGFPRLDTPRVAEALAKYERHVNGILRPGERCTFEDASRACGARTMGETFHDGYEKLKKSLSTPFGRTKALLYTSINFIAAGLIANDHLDPTWPNRWFAAACGTGALATWTVGKALFSNNNGFESRLVRAAAPKVNGLVEKYNYAAVVQTAQGRLKGFGTLGVISALSCALTVGSNKAVAALAFGLTAGAGILAGREVKNLADIAAENYLHGYNDCYLNRLGLGD